jgi:hypothetical protein
MYWTLGQYDQVCVFDAPDDETAASVLLAADMLGNIRHTDIAVLSPPRDGEDPRQGALITLRLIFCGICGSSVARSSGIFAFTCSPFSFIPLNQLWERSDARDERRANPLRIIWGVLANPIHGPAENKRPNESKRYPW